MGGVVFRVCLIAVAALLTGPVLADNSQSSHGSNSQSVTSGAPDGTYSAPGDDGTIINPDGDDDDADSPDDDGGDDGDSPDDSGGAQDLPATNPV